MRVLILLSAALVFFAPLTPGNATIFSDCVSGKVDRILSGCPRVLELGARVAQGNRAAAYYNLGWALSNGPGENQRAIDAFGRSIELNPQFAPAYYQRSVAYFHLGVDDKALADATAAIGLDPNAPNYFEQRGAVRTFLGDYDGAIADLDAAIRLAPTDAQAYRARANAYSEKKDYARAIADDDAALRILPGDPDVTQDREQAKAALDDSSKPKLVAPKITVSTIAPPPGLVPSSGTSVSQSEKLALLIGNSAYVSLPKLDNPRRDAEDLAEGLTALGFKVSLAVDLDRDTMEDRLADFAKAARKSDVALIFFSGHGLQFNGVNYLVPVDAKLDDETDLRHLVSLSAVLNDLEDAPRVRLLILDACRETGALQRLAASLPAKRGVAVKRGLAREDAEGTLIAYATQAGSLASYGSGRRNSPFTAALLHHLGDGGIDIRVLFTRVRSDVYKDTGGTQNPEVSDSLVGEFAFK